MNIARLLSRMSRGLWHLPKTLYINLKLLPFKQAVKLPFIVMGKCSVSGCSHNNVTIDGSVHTGMIRLGAQKTSKRGIQANRCTSLLIDSGGSIIFQGNCSIGAGSSICASGGEIVLGNDFSCNVNCLLYSKEFIHTGSDVLLGWNINIRDNDGHPIYNSKRELLNPDKGITLGNHVWISSYADILKGVTLADGIVVGTRSLVTKSFTDANTIIAGTPARIVKEDAFWEHRPTETDD